ncbi:ERF family protein [Oleidesulfovibrio sp.]|uniref:ERF family protein n=1 Tax=Oleidesulfovibrio sp. TaxID=2909707 RepID=UPI003A8863BA
MENHIITCSESITELAKAMLQVQQGLVPVMKDAANPFVGSRYASLNSVVEACREALTASGIWVVQYPVQAVQPIHEGTGCPQSLLGLVTKLVHAESGQWQSSLMVMPLPKADPQGYGSALTYARRYGLATLVGLVTEVDDDAQEAMPRNQQRSSGRKSVPQARASENDARSMQEPKIGKGTAKSGKDTDAGAAQNTTEIGSPRASQNPLSIQNSLPAIDGVLYQTVQTQDGRNCITASGLTRTNAAQLKEAGFRWDASRKLWWRYAQRHAA